MSRYDATPVGLVAPYRTVADAFIDILWIEGSCYFVGCCFIILAAAGLVLSVIELTSKKKGEWKLRPIALLLLMVFCIMVALFFLGFRFFSNETSLSAGVHLLVYSIIIICLDD